MVGLSHVSTKNGEQPCVLPENLGKILQDVRPEFHHPGKVESPPWRGRSRGVKTRDIWGDPSRRESGAPQDG